jgi:hypothetical protein
MQGLQNVAEVAAIRRIFDCLRKYNAATTNSNGPEWESIMNVGTIKYCFTRDACHTWSGEYAVSFPSQVLRIMMCRLANIRGKEILVNREASGSISTTFRLVDNLTKRPSGFRES